MFDGAVFPLADQRGAGEQDAKLGDVVDHRRHRGKPGGAEVGVEQAARHQLDGRRRGGAPALGEGADLLGDDALDVAGAGLGLALAGGVHVELDRRLAAGQHVALEVGRDVEHEGVAPGVHVAVHLGEVELGRRDELGRLQRGDDARRELGAVLVHHRHRGPVQALGLGVGVRVDRHREHEDDQEQHCHVAQQAVELLEAQVPGVVEEAGAGGHRGLRQRPCLRSSSIDSSVSTGTATSSGTKAPPRSAKSRALAKVPRLMVRKWVVG